MALGARIKHYRDQAGLTLEELSERSGVEVGTISALENRDSTRSKFALPLAAALGLTLEQLLDDRGAAPALPRSARVAFENVSEGPDVGGLVPLISWIRAGDWHDAADPFQPGDAERWMACSAAHSASTFALRVRGDSMTAPHGNSRTYPEGCIIFVDPERRAPVNGERVVAQLDGSNEVTFKVYKNEDGRQWLQPLNPSHEPIREPFHVIGLVIGKWEDE